MNLSKDIGRIVLVGIGITSLASLIYLAGPLVVIGDYRPLENYVVREIAIFAPSGRDLIRRASAVSPPATREGLGCRGKRGGKKGKR